MNQKEKPEISIDVGSGDGKYFFELADKSPEKMFVILDPQIVKKSDRNIPSNLHFIEWKSDVDSTMPFKKNSIDEANINFLMGEIQNKNESRARTAEESLKNDLEKYRKILVDIKDILKDGAILHIVDVRGNIDYISNLLQEEGFIILNGPVKLEDGDRTEWSKIFSDLSKRAALNPWHKDQGITLPMQIMAKVDK